MGFAVSKKFSLKNCVCVYVCIRATGKKEKKAHMHLKLGGDNIFPVN